MNILITGGAGYVGDCLTSFLLHSAMHNEVRVYDSLLYEDSYRKEVPFVSGDVRDHKKLREQLDWADAVVWLAGIVGDGACALNPLRATEVNYEAVKFLADNFEGRIVFPSSCSIYGAQDGVLTEDSPTNPLSLYASAKLKAEGLLKDKNAIIFRLGTLFGLSGKHSRLRLDLVANTLTAKAVTERKLRVFGGEQYRPLLHVRDAAQTMFESLFINSQTKVFDTGIFNLHYENMKIIDLARRVVEHVQGTDLDIVETTYEDSRNYRASSQKAIDIFGFKPTLDIDYGITEVKELLESGRIKDTNNPRYTNQGFLSHGA